MKTRLLTIGVVLAAAFMFFTVWTGGASNQINKNWEVELPKDGTEVYCFNAKEGTSYYAFIYDEEETAQNAFDWVEDGETAEYESYDDAIDAWMDEAEVPKSLPIDIPEGKYYYEKKADGSELIIAPDKRMLHIVEKLAQ